MAALFSLFFLLAPACHASVLLSTGASPNNSSTTFIGNSSTSSRSLNSLLSSVAFIPNSTSIWLSSSNPIPLSTGVSSSTSLVPLGTSTSSSSLPIGSSSTTFSHPNSTSSSATFASISTIVSSPNSTNIPLGTSISSSPSSSLLGTGISSSLTSVTFRSGSSSSANTALETGASSSASVSITSGTSVSTTGTGASSTSPEPTPVSSPTSTVDIPTTTVTGTAETSAAVQIGPLLLGIWQNRDWIHDKDNKQNYIDDVKSVDNNINLLLKDIPDPPSPPSECEETSAKKRGLDARWLQKRSIISGILNDLSDVATAISCAKKLTDNLVHVVKSTPIDADEIATLTDALKDLSDKLKDDEQTSTSQSTSSSSQSSSCTASSAVPSCIRTTLLSTLFSTASGTTSSSVKTITTSSCTTITACSATATTVTTTTSSSSTTSEADYIPCAYHCLQSSACGYPSASASASERKRAALPTPDSASIAKREIPALVGDRLAKRTLIPIKSISDYVDYVEENAQGGGQLDWTYINYQATSNNFAFDGTSARKKWVEGVTGCTVIAIVSQRGFWWSHLMEPGFLEKDDQPHPAWDSIINAITNGDAKMTAPSSLAETGGILEQTDDNAVTIYVFSPAAKEEYDMNGDPLPATAKYPTKLDTLMGLLKNNHGAPFANAAKSVSYYEWPNESVPKEAVGKVIFEYDPEGTTDNTCQAVYRFWLFDKPIEVHFTGSTTNSKAKRKACSLSQSASSSATSSASSTTSASSTGVSITGASSTDASSKSVTPSNSSSSSPATISLSTTTTSPSVPTASTSDATSTLPYNPVGSTGPNQNNRCHVHVWEYNLEDTLVAQVQLWDAAGNQILAKTDVERIDVDNGHTWDCPLQRGFTVTNEAALNAVGFETGYEVFDTTTQGQIWVWCNTGGWATVDSDKKERQMDCYFHCPWSYENGTSYPSADTLHNP